MTLSRHCPVCDTPPDRATVFVEESIDRSKLTQFSFASRKEPEYMSHRLVLCPTCDLVYVDQPPGEDELGHAYHVADYNSTEEANDAATAYIRAIAPTLAQLKRRQSALEIGTGTGVFLEHLARAGFSTLAGVEPSHAAIEAAPQHRKAWIREARNPGAIARSAWRLLRPGGAFVTVTDNYRSFVNRLLGRRSPIIDVEHMQLFSPGSARRRFESSNYRDVTVAAFVDTYAIRYWLRLLPLTAGIKRSTAAMLKGIGLGGVKLPFNVGNIITAGYKAG